MNHPIFAILGAISLLIWPITAIILIKVNDYIIHKHHKEGNDQEKWYCRNSIFVYIHSFSSDNNNIVNCSTIT